MKVLAPAGDTATCANCRFYAAANGQAGECRRFAPDFGEDTRRASWPILTAASWCGEFEMRFVPSEVDPCCAPPSPPVSVPRSAP